MKLSCASLISTLLLPSFSAVWMLTLVGLAATPTPARAQEYVAHRMTPADILLPEGLPLERLYRLSTVIDGPAAEACANGNELEQSAGFTITSVVPLSMIDRTFPSEMVLTNIGGNPAPPRGFVILMTGTDGWSVASISGAARGDAAATLELTVRGTNQPHSADSPCLLQIHLYGVAPPSTLDPGRQGPHLGAGSTSAASEPEQESAGLEVRLVGLDSVAGWIAAGLSVKEVITRIRGAITEILAEAEETGNALMSRFANEMTVLANLAEIVFERQLDRAARILDEKSKEAFLKFDELILKAAQSAQQAYEEKDALVVDLANLMGSLPFASRPVFIQSISGVTQLQGDGVYPIRIIATGLGPGSADKQAAVRLSVNGQPVSPQSTDSSQSNRITLNLANETLRPLFDPQAIAFATLTVELDLRWKGGLFNWFTKRRTVTSELQIALFPRFAGRFTVAADEPVYGWKSAGTTDDVWVSPDCGQGKCNVVHTLSVKAAGGNAPELGNRRLVGLSRDCVPLWGPRACEWSYEQMFGINANATAGLFVVRHDGERVRWTLTGTLEEYARLGVQTNRHDVDAYYGENFWFDIASDNTFFRITGQTLTRRPVDVVKGQASPYFKYVGSYDVPPNKTRYVYQVVAPVWPGITAQPAGLRAGAVRNELELVVR